MTSPSVTHAMTIDVEDYFHVAALAEAIKPEEWNNWPSRVEGNTERLMALFDEKGIKATFFVLGWVANKYPELVKRISDNGHEVASHGYSHQLVYGQSPEVFRQETQRSRELLRDLSQQPVDGYRAASYSITQASPWAIDILAELGFTWDSSIFPVHHDRYGVPGSPEEPYWIETVNGARLKEFPLTTAKIGPLAMPAAGGGYFRQYPYALSRWLFERASLGETKPQIFYLHPWEIDPEQPQVSGLSWFSKFRHYTNLEKCYGRLERMLDDFAFGTMGECLSSVTIEKSFTLQAK